MRRERRLGIIAVASLVAVGRLALPAPVQAQDGTVPGIAVPVCGEPGHFVVLGTAGRAKIGGRGGTPARKPGDSGPAPCCTICHSAMRKRAGGASCCDEEDDPDVA